MNLEELRTVQNKERQTDSLQHLRDSFYGDVGEYISELKAERDRAAAEADDPFSAPEVSRLTDEIETAESVVEAIWERRMGKLVKRASLAAAGMSADDQGLTAEEKELFATLVEEIESNRAQVLDALSGDPTAESPDQDTSPDDGAGTSAAEAFGEDLSSTDDADQTTDGSDASDRPPGEGSTSARPEANPGTSAAEPDAGRRTPASEAGGAADGAPDRPATDRSPSRGRDGSDAVPDDDRRGEDSDRGGSPVPPERTEGGDSDGGSTGESNPRTTVRITRDVGEIYGVDEREYHLASEDVVQLPTANAEPLIERDAAEPLD